MRTCFTVLFILIYFVPFSQDDDKSREEALKSRIRLAKTLKERISANYAMGNYLLESDSLAAEKYYDIAYDLSVAYKNLEGQSKYFYFKATSLYNNGLFPECEKMCRTSLGFLTSTKDTVLKLHVIGMLLNAMEYQSIDIRKEKELLDYFEMTSYLDQRPDIGPNVARGFIYACLSWFYIQKDDEKSLDAFMKQYECYKKVGNDELLMSFHINYAHYNLYLRNFAEATEQAKMAVDICKKLGNRSEMDFMLSSISMATMLIYDGKFHDARKIYNNVVSVSTRMRQELIESEQKSYQLELANAKVKADRKIMLIMVISSLVLMSLLYLLLRWFYRLKALKAEIALKEGIAMDLHDEVGTMLTKTIFLAQNILNSDEINDPRLKQIVEQSRQVNASFRDAIWSADTRTDALLNLVDRINDAGHQITEGTPFIFYFHRNQDLKKRRLKAVEKRNIMLMVREAMHNAIKHSNGNRIDLSIVPEGEKLIFTIADNGTENNQEHNKYGMGLYSMRQRAEKMRAEIFIGSTSDGFVVRFIV
jgi:signal transduction histidine kinase